MDMNIDEARKRIVQLRDRLKEDIAQATELVEWFNEATEALKYLGGVLAGKVAKEKRAPRRPEPKPAPKAAEPPVAGPPPVPAGPLADNLVDALPLRQTSPNGRKGQPGTAGTEGNRSNHGKLSRHRRSYLRDLALRAWKASGRTRAEVAAEVGVLPQTFGRWIRGKSRMLEKHVVVLEAIAAGTHVWRTFVPAQARAESTITKAELLKIRLELADLGISLAILRKELDIRSISSVQHWFSAKSRRRPSYGNAVKLLKWMEQKREQAAAG